MSTVYLHLGYHKTATTFLQRFIYPKMKEVNYVKQKHIKSYLRRIRLKKLSDFQIKETREYFNSFSNGQPMLISYEGLSGSPFAPKKTKKQTSILKDLRRIFPESDYDVYTIIGIREQVALFTSLYVQHIHQGGVRDAKDYIKYCEHNGSLQNFHFHQYLKKIEEIFGRDHLYLMVYENFKRNPSDEMLKLLNYMGEREIPRYKDGSVRKANKSFGTAQVAIARRLNRFFKTPMHPQGWLPVIHLPKFGPLLPRTFLQNKFSYALHYKKYELPEDLQASLRERYLEGNKKLAETYEINLPNTYLQSKMSANEYRTV